MSAAVSAEPLWQIEGVQLWHGRRAWPDEPLSVAVPSGRVAVLGFSGAGKTTLLNLLAGFQSPERGTIRRPAKVAWVPQDHGLWLKHSVLDHLILAGATAEEARQLLADFDLLARASARAEILSIGEGARLAVARALAQKSPVLVMDQILGRHPRPERRSLIRPRHASAGTCPRGSRARDLSSRWRGHFPGRDFHALRATSHRRTRQLPRSRQLAYSGGCPAVVR